MTDEPTNSLPAPSGGAGGDNTTIKTRLSALLERMREAVNRAFDFKTSPVRALLITAVCLLALFLAVWVFDKIFAYFVARSYVQEIANVFDLIQHLANAI